MKNKFTKNPIIIFLAVSLIAISFWIINRFEIVVNYSDSLPYHFVIIDKKLIPTKREQIFVFYVYDNKQLGNKKIKFIKKIAGLPFDKIIIDNKKIFVANKFIGVIKNKSRNNQALSAIDKKIIGEHQYFAYAPHKDSFDSRYNEIGLIDEKNIVGTAIFAF